MSDQTLVDAPAAPEAKVPRRGRPIALSDECRRAALLDAARATFYRVGYGPATMSEIAAAAGMSKKTLYQVFPSKAALVHELVRRDCQCPDDALLEGCDRATPEEVLTHYVSLVAELVLSPRAIAMQRLVIGEALREPELTAIFSREIMEKAPESLVAWLDRQKAAGLMQFDNANEAVDVIFGLTLSSFHWRILLGGALSLDAGLLKSRIEQGVRTFLALVRYERAHE
jgi:AcrR family transcriptional regulator